MSTKVAIITPTMNRPDFILRQLWFYEQMSSPHPVYISDSSNEENARKIQEEIKKLKKPRVVYRWDPPGKDCLYRLLPFIKEKYCMLVNDDDIIIPETISECGDFLELHPDYGTCSGKQVNFHFRQEYFNKAYGIIESQTRPLCQSIEDENMFVRALNFLSNPDTSFVCFAVRRIETEKSIRNVTKNFSLSDDMFEFVLFNMLIISGRFKVLDKLGYVMQRSIVRVFDHGLTENFLTFSSFGEQWKVCEEGFSEFIRSKGFSREESVRIVRWLFLISLANQYSADWMYVGPKKFTKRSLPASKTRGVRFKVKKIKHLISQLPFLKTVYYKFKPPYDVTRPESKYFNDYKMAKDFLEKGV